MSAQVEQHGCIVCGKTYMLKVTYAGDGKIQKCIVTTLGGRRVIDERRPFVVCDSHSTTEIELALTRHSRRDKEKDEED